jgi:hypothetical protein
VVCELEDEFDEHVICPKEMSVAQKKQLDQLEQAQEALEKSIKSSSELTNMSSFLKTQENDFKDGMKNMLDSFKEPTEMDAILYEVLKESLKTSNSSSSSSSSSTTYKQPNSSLTYSSSSNVNKKLRVIDLDGVYQLALSLLPNTMELFLQAVYKDFSMEQISKIVDSLKEDYINSVQSFSDAFVYVVNLFHGHTEVNLQEEYIKHLGNPKALNIPFLQLQLWNYIKKNLYEEIAHMIE